MFHGSPPVRAVLITAKALDISLNIRELKYVAGDLFKPEYLKLNPQHTVPTLDNDGKILCDSHAINAYLVEEYSKDDSLYPKNTYKRALVNQRLHFDSSVLFPAFKSIIMQVFSGKMKEIPQDKVAEIKEAYGYLEKFLERQQWIAGDCLTIADFSCVTSVTSLNVIVPLDSEIYPNVTNWIKRAQELPCFASEPEELEMFRNLFQKMLCAPSV